MKRKPDLLWIFILFGLGVVTTGYAQSLWSNKTDAPVELAQSRHNRSSVDPSSRRR
jgi:type IV secretory pathway TrbD component